LRVAWRAWSSSPAVRTDIRDSEVVLARQHRAEFGPAA
jgi:hypothetical protein